jgi:hypothetical protein
MGTGSPLFGQSQGMGHPFLIMGKGHGRVLTKGKKEVLKRSKMNMTSLGHQI